MFSNKVSGVTKIEDREEIQSLIQYVKEHQIDRVVCLEISRVGRNTLEALKIIQFLNENRVSLNVKNYNLETLDNNGNVNPITSLICTILLEISQMERPSTYRKSVETYTEQYQKEISLLKKGYSLSNISKITGTSINTIKKVKDTIL